MVHYVYTLLLSNGQLYTGETNNPRRRWREHERGKGSKFMRNKPFIPVTIEIYDTQRHGKQREYALKHKYSQHKKAFALLEKPVKHPGYIESRDVFSLYYHFLIIRKQKFKRKDNKISTMLIEDQKPICEKYKPEYGETVNLVIEEIVKHNGSIRSTDLIKEVLPLLGISQPTYYTHIKKMLFEGRIFQERDGRCVSYEI